MSLIVPLDPTRRNWCRECPKDCREPGRKTIPAPSPVGSGVQVTSHVERLNLFDHFEGRGWGGPNRVEGIELLIPLHG
jgi:hypothetical protein